MYVCMFCLANAVVTCKMKHWNNCEIISVFYFNVTHGFTIINGVNADSMDFSQKADVAYK